MADEWEHINGLDSTKFSDKFEDPDLDGLPNIMEFLLDTNPLNWDTNNNSISDLEEFAKGTLSISWKKYEFIDWPDSLLMKPILLYNFYLLV